MNVEWILYQQFSLHKLNEEFFVDQKILFIVPGGACGTLKKTIQNTFQLCIFFYYLMIYNNSNARA